MSTSILQEMAMELTEVPPSTTPMEKVVLGLFGTSSSEYLAMALPMAKMGLGMPKSPLECPPGPLKVTSYL